MTSGRQSIKIVFVGDGAVGKTCVLEVYRTSNFPKEYVPTVVDNYVQDVSIDNRSVRLCLWDTAGQEDYERLRPLSYPGTAVFIVCFSVDNRSSYLNVAAKWCTELKHYAPGVPQILVGTKTDLRTDPNTIEHLKRQNATIISPEEGQALADQVGARKYIECSAKLKQGIAYIFEEAVRAHFGDNEQSKKKKKLNCHVL